MEELVIHVDVPVPAVPDARAICGGGGTGKTSLLVERARELVRGGVDPCDVLVVCATPDTAALFERRVGTPGLRCACARELELEVLADNRSRAYTGRAPRLLTKFELDFLREDLKVGGAQPKRLKGLLKFFDRSFTELADEDDHFLIDGDEIDAMERIERNLAMTQGVFACQLPELAVRCLRDLPDVRSDFSHKHVLVDDYQLLCRASQLFTNFLARGSLWVAGDPDGCVEAFEPYPYAAGMDEFVDGHPGCEVVQLESSCASAGVLAAVNGLRGDTDLGCAPLMASGKGGDTLTGQAAAHGFQTATDELRGVVELVKNAIGSGVAPNDVYVCVPNHLWASNVVRALGQVGVASASLLDARRSVGGDVADERHSLLAREFTLLMLAGDPDDGVAWRSWCGFGAYLARSGAIDELRELANRDGKTLPQVLRCLVDEDGSGLAGGDSPAGGLAGDGPDVGGPAVPDFRYRQDVRDILAAYLSGLAIVQELSCLRGDALLDRIAAEVGDARCEIRGLCLAACAQAEASGPKGGDSDGEDGNGDGGGNGGNGKGGNNRDANNGKGGIPADAGAAELRELVLRALALPRNMLADDSVPVGGLSDCAGRSPRVVVVCGCVDGFLPGHDFFEITKTVPGKIHTARGEALRQAYVLFSKARESLECTYFRTIDLDLAGRLDLKAERIFAEGNRKMAALSPSLVLYAAGLLRR